MGFKNMILDAAKDILGDDHYSLLRHGDVARRGLAAYEPDFACLGNSPKNLLTCCPDYENIGDHAIALAEKRFLAEHSEHPTLAFAGDTTALLMCFRRHVTPNDVIFLQGGGNMDLLYRNEEEQRLRLISSMRHNRIILFPQTMSYGDTDEERRFLRHTQKVYGAHPDLHLFAREQVSYERMKRAYPDNDVRLVPDIVLSVRGEDNVSFSQRHGVLLCMRNDVEQRLGSQSYQMIEAIAESTGEPWSYTDTTVPGVGHVAMSEGERLVHDKWSEFKRSRLVITDRLHGMIFSAITGTPCVALNNANGKVGFEYQWLKDLPYIAFAHSADEVKSLVSVVLAVNDTHFPADQFAEAFEPLAALVR